MLIIFARTIILFLLVMIVIRVMGKRQIGELQPFELVLAIMIAELATVPMEDKEIPLINGIIPILTLLLLQVIITFISLKSDKLRGLISGTPSVLIENGKIIESELRKLRYNLTDLLEQLRLKNFPNIADIEYAILETSGELSIIPKSQKRPVTPEDLNIHTAYEGLTLPLIMDGHVKLNNLQKLNLDTKWLNAELNKFGIKSTTEVLLASLDTKGELYIQKKGTKANKAGTL
ncbi:DUF421 domain-containing protein [Desulfitibacter alkalitolerans]|uniref:DUF421 domain-containing protein n=1 Tax=Desulfitibacter alkalitolerans TaxID=264641 RepID=UPI000486CB79|nr:DUF421 domain-containing protein [Desulfitibacter alkalitolerans]